MQADLINPIITLVSVLAAFVWLRNDMKSLRDDLREEIQQSRQDTQDDIQQLRNDFQQLREDTRNDFQRLESKVDGLDSRLRAVESEQSRVAGLLEGLALSGALPDRES